MIYFFDFKLVRILHHLFKILNNCNMKRIIVLFALFPTFLLAQELKLITSSQQTINAGAFPSSTTNYLIQIQKEKRFNWHIDSLYSISSNKKIQYNITKVDSPNAVSPIYKQVKLFSKKDIGIFQINFGTRKALGGGKPNAPVANNLPPEDYSKGVVLFYTANKKKKELKISVFEKLESINAP